MAMHPYERIAADLEQRVRAGKLAAGAKVPSTRVLARKWKVAEATAARALRMLITRGVLRSAPRSATVVVGPSRAEPSGELSRARIVAAAVRVADEEGLEALSLRAVAARIGAPVMSLYRHVASKDELLLAMSDAAMGELSWPAEPPAGWRAQLEVASRLEWAVFRRHPWLARVAYITRPTISPASAAFAEWVFRALSATPLDAADKLRVHVLLHSFVQGLAVNIEAEERALGDTGISADEHMRAHEPQFEAMMASGRFPHFATVLTGMPAEFDLAFDDLFERGLRALLDGLTPEIERPARAVNRRRA